MSDRKENRQEAIKIFEALSAVDEELLERSEKGTEKKVVPFMKYSRMIAACFCLIVVGGLVYGGVRFVTAPAKSAAPMNTADMALEEIEQESAKAMNAEDVGGSANIEEGAVEEELVAEAEKEEQKNIVQDNGNGSLDAKNDVEVCVDSAKARQEITEQEARDVEKIGAYIPKTLPAGYKLGTAHLVKENGKDMISIYWTKGMDDIMIWVSDIGNVADMEGLSIADVSKPETYDEHLYDIPYADTVPEEYGEIFYNPIFRAEDFTEDIVAARMKAPVGDSGDTNTPRGNFAVLYKSGVLVRFNGRGTTAQIWQMFQSIEAGREN